MPARITCPRCGKAGLVRIERVIRGSTSFTEFFCGQCLHHWTRPDLPAGHDDPESTGKG
jgi:hypothetical protein